MAADEEALYDLLTEAGTGNLGGFRSGCTSHLVVAVGVLNAPDSTRTWPFCTVRNSRVPPPAPSTIGVRATNLVAVGGIGTAGGASIVNLPSPHPVFEDIASDGFILPKDIPADAEPAG